MLSRGLISGHWTRGPRRPATSAPTCPASPADNLERNLALVEALRDVAEERGATVAQVAIAWVLSRGEDIVPLVGARTPDRLSESLGALDLRAEPATTSPRSRPPCLPTRPPAPGTTRCRCRSSTARSERAARDRAADRRAILDTAEEVLRRFGPAKATVVDVARALDVSHGSVYRHFPSKAALRDAVTERWLARVSEPLEVIVTRRGTARAGCTTGCVLLASTKQGMAAGRPRAVRDVPTS